MAALAGASRVHFSSEQKILDYLAKHPLTDDRNPKWYAEKKISQAVARAFANATMDFENIRSNVRDILNNLNLGVPEPMMNIITHMFGQALIDFGNNRPIESLHLRDFIHCAS
jgi:hypothetical protein